MIPASASECLSSLLSTQTCSYIIDLLARDVCPEALKIQLGSQYTPVLNHTSLRGTSHFTRFHTTAFELLESVKQNK